MDQINQGITAGILAILIAWIIMFIVKRYPRGLKTIVILQFLVIISIALFITSVTSLMQLVMTWLLTNEHFILLMLSPVWFTMFIGFYAYFRPDSHIFHPHANDRKFGVFVIIYFLVSVGIVFIFCDVSTVYESDHTWKTVYTNNIDADVSLSIHKSRLLGSETVTVNSELMWDVTKLQHEGSGRLRLTKNGVTETREVHFDPQNVNGTLNEHSKITKIEYRPITKTYNTLFGFSGEYEQPDVDGEVRITVEQDATHAELKSLFGD